VTMDSTFLPVALSLLLLASLSGCSEVITRTKPPSEGSRITEEDITDTRPPEIPQQQPGEPPPGFDAPSTLSTEGVPSNVNPANRPPRRLIWRDRGRQERGWAPAPEAPLETEH
jgi:hypothetical protein